MSPQERMALHAALGNAVDTLQAELEAYRILLFVFLMDQGEALDGAPKLHSVFGRARAIIEERTLTGVTLEEAERQRAATLAALNGLSVDLDRVAQSRNAVRATAN